VYQITSVNLKILKFSFKICFQELKELTQIRLMRKSEASKHAVVNMGDSSFEHRMLPPSRDPTPDTESLSERSVSEHSVSEQSSRSSISISGSTFSSASISTFTTPVPVPRGQQVAGAHQQRPGATTAHTDAFLKSSDTVTTINDVKSGTARPVYGYSDPVPVNTLRQPTMVPVPVSSSRSMRARPSLTLPCPSPVADATERELIESENPSPPAAPLSKFGPMGFRKSLLKFLDSDSDLSDLDLSKHSKSGLDLSTHGLSWSNNGNRASVPTVPLSSMMNDVHASSEKLAETYDRFSRLANSHLQSQLNNPSTVPSSGSRYMKSNLQLSLAKNISYQSDTEDPLDVCRHGDIKP